MDNSDVANVSFDYLEDEDLVNCISMISYIMNGWFTTFFVVTGITLNFFSIFIFLRCERTGTPAIQYYLVTLTIWQTALLCNAFILYSLPHLIFGHFVSSGKYVYIYPFAYTFANTTHVGSVWIVLALTIDRYLALCKPLTHRSLGKKSRVKRLMIGISLVAVLFSFVRFFEVEVVEQCTEIIEENVKICEPTIERTKLVQSSVYWMMYHVILGMLCVTLCPCLMLCGLTARISIELRNAVAQRRQLCPPNLDIDRRCKTRIPVYSRKEHKANIMLVLVIAKFLISDILPTVADLLEHVIGQEKFMRSPLASLFVDISNFLLVLNCSSNFWVFIFWGKRFRKSVKNFVLSTNIGATIWRITKFGSETDVTSVLIPTASPFAPPYEAMPRSQARVTIAVSSKCTEVRTYASTGNTRRISSCPGQDNWDYERNDMLQTLERERR